MKHSIALFFSAALCLFSLPAAAQSGSPNSISGFRAVAPVQPNFHPAQSRTSSGFGSNTGWGSVANPGTGHPPNTTIGGLPKNGMPARSGNGHGRGLYTGGFAFAYPTYIPGYAESVTANPQDQQAFGPSANDRPTVVIQNFYPTNGGQQQAGSGYADNGNMQTYTAPSNTPADSAVNAGNYYLIALKDHHVYSALAFWTEGSTFHYVTTQNAHNQAPVDSIDVEMTKRLNQDSNMNLTVSGQ